MLDFVIFAFSVVLGLVFILFFFLLQSKKQDGPVKMLPAARIPGWQKDPSDPKSGDLLEMASHGSLHQYLLHRHDSGHCPVTSFWWGQERVVSVCSPDSFRDTKHLTNRPKRLYELFEPLIGSESIQFANGEDWEERRRRLYPSLKGAHLESYFGKFLSVAQEKAKCWADYPKGRRVALVEEAFSLTIKGMYIACLGDVLGSSEISQLSQAYHSCWREMEARLGEGEPEQGSERDRDFKRNRQVIRDLVQRVLSHQRDSGDHSSPIPFIDALLSSHFSEEQNVADTISFLIGGFHTSGNLLVWMLWYLANDPSVQDCLYEEIICEENLQDLKAYALSDKTYMRQVQNETLRLSTLAPYAARYSESETTVAGYSVPANTPIIHALGVALKSQLAWDNGESFDPSRFDEKRGLEFCPFGVPSQRKCPGYLFSYFEVSVFAAVLLKQFKLLPLEGQRVQMVHGLVTEPKEEVYLLLEPRNED